MTGPVARRVRRAARVVLLGPEGHVLLFRYTADGFDPFWILPGGECLPDEDFPEAAARELLEETGIRTRPIALDHVVEAQYNYLDEPVTSLEHYFHFWTTCRDIDTSGHTALERRVMREHRWFNPVEFGDWPETIYPRNLAKLVEALRQAAER